MMNPTANIESATAINAGFKQTEVGWIPVDWEVKKLGEISDIKTGPFGSSLHEKDYVIDGTPIITVEHLGELGITHESMPMVSDYDRKRLRSYIMQTNDIVFSRVGSVDRNSIVSEKEEGWLFSGRLLRIRTSSYDVYPKYLSYHFHQESFKHRIRSVAVGQTMASLNTRILKGIDVILPPTLAEQTAIATALSGMDALIQAQEELLAKKRALKQGAMQELLTGKRRLVEAASNTFKQTEVGRIPVDWEMIELQDAVDFLDGKRRPIKSSEREKMKGQYPYYGASGIIDYINNYLFDDELILLGEDGENIISRNSPLAFVVKGKVWVNNHAHVLKAKEGFDTYFLAEKLESLDYENYNSGTAQPKLNKKTCSTIRFPLPSTLTEQTAIATALSDMAALIQAQEAQLSKYRQLKVGMMQALLTGKKRLI